MLDLAEEEVIDIVVRAVSLHLLCALASQYRLDRCFDVVGFEGFELLNNNVELLLLFLKQEAVLI